MYNPTFSPADFVKNLSAEDRSLIQRILRDTVHTSDRLTARAVASEIEHELVDDEMDARRVAHEIVFVLRRQF